MMSKRFRHVSALMADGRILTAGGFDDWTSKAMSSTELFDPRTGQVDAGRNMTERRGSAAAAVLTDSVYVCGGYLTNSCERS